MATGPAEFHYRAFGLAVRSEMPLRELQVAPEAAPDIEIVTGVVPQALERPAARGEFYEAEPGRLLIRAAGAGRYLCEAGRRIVVERENGAAEDDVRGYLLTVAMGGLLHQRRDFVLHGSAIGTTTGAVAFVGASGVGKSTLAAAFAQRGYPVLSDDLCVLRGDPAGGVSLFPSFPHMKLWLDSLAALAIAPDGLRRILHKAEKRAVPLGGEFGGESLPLRRIYVLRPVAPEGVTVRRLDGVAKLAVLKNHTYRFGLLQGIGEQPWHFQAALALAKRVEIAAVRRHHGPFRLAALMAGIEADLAQS